MNSLATLPPGQTALTSASLALYATAATVIPVLFLAIAVQGPAYQNMLQASVARVRSQPGARGPRRVLGNVVSWLLLAAAYVILIAAGAGELGALVAMYSGITGPSSSNRTKSHGRNRRRSSCRRRRRCQAHVAA